MSALLDIRRIQDDVCRRPPYEWTWLDSSYVDPAGFLNRIHGEHAARRKLSVQSRVGERTNLFSDFLHRHANDDGLALCTIRAGVPRDLGYRALLRRVCQRATFLERRGVEQGAVVCLVARMDESLAVDLLALMKLGAVGSTIEPRGPSFVRHRMEALAPDFVVADSGYARWWASVAKVPTLIPEDTVATDADTDANGYAYAADEEVLRLFSPLADDPSLPIPVTADAVLRGAIRDALLVHRLERGERIGAPGFDAHQHQPSLLFSALFAGATFVQVDDDTLARRADLLPAIALSVVGLTNAMRANEVSESAAFRIGAPRWFSSLAEPLDVVLLQTQARALEVRGAKGVLTLANAAFGGTLLFVPHPAGASTLVTVPTPGQTWSLVELNESGMQTAGAGVFTSADSPTEVVGRFVLGPSASALYFAGAARPTRDGRTLPAREIALVAETHPRARHASLAVGAGRLPNTSRAVLLVFTDTQTPDPAIVEELRALIETQLGRDAVPDRVELYPLVPRLVDGRPDDVWCASHYFTGRLDRRRREPMLHAIAAARRAVLRMAEAAGGAS